MGEARREPRYRASLRGRRSAPGRQGAGARERLPGSAHRADEGTRRLPRRARCLAIDCAPQYRIACPDRSLMPLYRYTALWPEVFADLEIGPRARVIPSDGRALSSVGSTVILLPGDEIELT